MRNRHLVASAFAVLVVTSLLVPFLGVTGEAASSDGFNPSITKEHIGDIAYITIDPQSEIHDPVVKIGDVEEDGYEIKFRIQGDYHPYEKIVFAYDTTAAGHPDKKTIRLVNSGDYSKGKVDIIKETELKDPPIDPSSYSMRLYDGNGELVDIGQLDLLKADKPSVAITKVPSDASRKEILGSKQSSSKKVAVGDLAVFKFDAHGTSAYIPDSVDATTLKKGGPIHDKHGVYLTLRDLSAARNEAPNSYSLDHITVYQDPVKDKLYLSVDSKSYDSMNVGDTVQLTLHVEKGNKYLPAGEYTEAFKLVERKGSFDAGGDNKYVVRPNGGLTVSGQTTVAPGSEVTVFIRSDENPPIYRKKVVTVTDKNKFSATFDFDGVPEGTVPVRFKSMSGSATIEITNSTGTTTSSDGTSTSDSTPVEQPSTTDTKQTDTETSTKTKEKTTTNTKTKDGPKKIGDKPPRPGQLGFTFVTVLFAAILVFALAAIRSER